MVDGDARSLRVLEVSLRKAGFMVTAAQSVQDALDKLVLHAPDLIISETTFPDGDGFELRSRVRATPEWSEIPFIFLTAEAAIENKIRGLELGVDDYLTKPIYIKEIVTRINILLQKRQRVRFEERRDGRTRFAGRVQDMPVVDVIQTIEISRKSGVIQFVGERGRQAAIYFRDGRVIDAEAGALQGEDAVYRLLTWSEGEFEVVFRTVRRREVITMSSQALLMEGMRRLDEWSRLFEQLPPLTHRFEVDTIELAARLGDVPDDNNRILRLFDGKRTLLEVIDATDVRDLECLQAISRLYFEELLIDLDHDKAPRRDTGRGIPLVEVDTPSPLKEVTSGPMSLHATVSDSGPHSAGAVAEDGSAATTDGTGGDVAARRGLVDARRDAPHDAVGGEAAADAAPHGGVPEAVVEDPGSDLDLGDVGPLMGGYRPSSLRLIDEAVAAAQAIEPSLFETPDEPAQAPPPAHAGNGVSRSAHVDAGAGAAAGERAGAGERVAGAGGLESGVVVDTIPSRSAEREESGLRMIGSLGRDRAEASGELASLGHVRPRRSETARELVTILPRRVTRDIPVVTSDPLPQELAESLPVPTPTSPVLVPRTVSSPALEPPAMVPAHARVPLPGSGVRAASRSRRLLRVMSPATGRGPGLGALLLIVLAVVLAGTAVLLRLRRHDGETQRAAPLHDGAPTSAKAVVPVGATAGTEGKPQDSGSDGWVREAAAAGESRGRVVAANERMQGGAAPRGPGTDGDDAGSADRRGKPAPDGAADKVASARALFDRASDALQEGDFARALEHAEASLKLRRTARTYLLRAQAQQRLDRVDAALASVDAAEHLAPGFGTVWELRGRILWSARRRDEARVAFERFLEIEPNTPRSAAVRQLLDGP
jgi:DNA-binding response OmpR family regulator